MISRNKADSIFFCLKSEHSFRLRIKTTSFVVCCFTLSGSTLKRQRKSLFLQVVVQHVLKRLLSCADSPAHFEGLPLQAEERLCKAEAHFGATSRGSSSARVPSERRMKAQGLHRLSSLPVSAVCFIIPSALLLPPSQNSPLTLSHRHVLL